MQGAPVTVGGTTVTVGAGGQVTEGKVMVVVSCRLAKVERVYGVTVVALIKQSTE